MVAHSQTVSKVLAPRRPCPGGGRLPVAVSSLFERRASCTHSAQKSPPPARCPAPGTPPPGRSRRCSRPPPRPPQSPRTRGRHQAFWGLPPACHTRPSASCKVERWRMEGQKFWDKLIAGRIVEELPSIVGSPVFLIYYLRKVLLSCNKTKPLYAHSSPACIVRRPEALWVMLFGAIPSYWPWIFNCDPLFQARRQIPHQTQSHSSKTFVNKHSDRRLENSGNCESQQGFRESFIIKKHLHKTILETLSLLRNCIVSIPLEWCSWCRGVMPQPIHQSKLWVF